jgi:hypothetical protein
MDEYCDDANYAKPAAARFPPFQIGVRCLNRSHLIIGAPHARARRVMLGSVEPPRRNAMPTQIGENRTKKMLKANELVRGFDRSDRGSSDLAL